MADEVIRFNVAAFKTLDKIELYQASPPRAATSPIAIEVPPVPRAPAQRGEPALCIVEYYQLTTVPGDLGVTRNIVSSIAITGLTKQTWSVRTKHAVSKTASITQSAVESEDSSVSNDLSQSVRNSGEQAGSQDHSDWKVDASFHGEVDVGLTGGSADANAHASGSSNEVRDSYRNAVDDAVNRQIKSTDEFRKERKSDQQSSSAALEEGESIETKEIDNSQHKEPQNYLMCQLSVERLTALSLMNAKLGFFDARANKFELVPLSGMDTLLGRVIPDAGNRAQIRTNILKQISTVFDYRDDPRPFVEEVPLPNGSTGAKFCRVVHDLNTEVEIRRADGAVKRFDVPGIAVSATYRVLPIPVCGVVRGVA